MNDIVVAYKGDPQQAPSYGTDEAAGADLKACLKEDLILQPGQRALVPTGLHLEIPRGYEGQVRPRSGLAWKQGIGLLNSPGTIDSDYRGEVMVIMINLGQEAVTISHGQRIAQLVIAPVLQVKFKAVEDLQDTERGAGGFGSTGTH